MVFILFLLIFLLVFSFFQRYDTALILFLMVDTAIFFIVIVPVNIHAIEARKRRWDELNVTLDCNRKVLKTGGEKSYLGHSYATWE